jgi:hypothetical protein
MGAKKTERGEVGNHEVKVHYALIPQHGEALGLPP